MNTLTRQRIFDMDITLKDIPLISNMVEEGHIKTIIRELATVIRSGVQGDVVELGCNVGTTSLHIQKYIDLLWVKKDLHVYDSFEGLPEPGEEDENNIERKFSKGDCLCTLQTFVDNFKNYNVSLPVIHQGWFKNQNYPDKICFAFFDGDLYESIMDSWEMVYPRLVKGAVVLVHDYGWPPLPGAKKACQDFLKGKFDIAEAPAENYIGIFYKFK